LRVRLRFRSVPGAQLTDAHAFVARSGCRPGIVLN